MAAVRAKDVEEDGWSWPSLEFWVDFKETKKQDVFSVLLDRGGANITPILAEQFVHDFSDYASLQFKKQHRLFSFFLSITDDEARFLRFEPSGTLTVSERFNYCDRPKVISEFLWRYERMSDMERGMANGFSTEEEGRKLWVAAEYFTKKGKNFLLSMQPALSSDHATYTVSVPSEDHNDDEYIVSGPTWTNGSTVVSPALDLATNKLVCLRQTCKYSPNEGVGESARTRHCVARNALFPLESVRSSKELVQVMRDVVQSTCLVPVLCRLWRNHTKQLCPG